MRGWKKANSHITTLDFRRAEQSFSLLRDLPGRITGQWPRRELGVQKSWLFFKGSNPQSSGRVHALKQEIMQKQQEVCTDEENSNTGRKHTRDGNKDR